MTFSITGVGGALNPAIPTQPTSSLPGRRSSASPLPKAPAFLRSPVPSMDTYIDIYFLYPSRACVTRPGDESDHCVGYLLI